MRIRYYGKEFSYHEKIANELQSEFYFAFSYSSWERGLNENTNGLVRQYLKKGYDLSEVTGNILSGIIDKLNNRPRKTLGYAPPNEAFYGKIGMKKFGEEVAVIWWISA